MSLTAQHCMQNGQAPLLDQTDIGRYLAQLTDWQQHGASLQKRFHFKNYYETLAFVNASAWVSHQEDHHPILEVHYNQCLVIYSTHTPAGITLNDFICAAKLDALCAA